MSLFMEPHFCVALIIRYMTDEDLYQSLHRELKDVYESDTALMEFLPFPDDVTSQKVMPLQFPCSRLFYNENQLVSKKFNGLQAAIHAATKSVHWRQTYKDTDIGDDFMDRFGCYSIIGDEAPFKSDLIRLFMVYMPAGLYYPWHQHPAEEIYFVVSGSAVFSRSGHPDKVLTEGQTAFHSSNQPHAMETQSEPILCLVVWRNHFETPPVLCS